MNRALLTLLVYTLGSATENGKAERQPKNVVGLPPYQPQPYIDSSSQNIVEHDHQRYKRTHPNKKPEISTFGYAWNIGNGASYMKMHVDSSSNPSSKNMDKTKYFVERSLLNGKNQKRVTNNKPGATFVIQVLPEVYSEKGANTQNIEKDENVFENEGTNLKILNQYGLLDVQGPEKQMSNIYENQDVQEKYKIEGTSDRSLGEPSVPGGNDENNQENVTNEDSDTQEGSVKSQDITEEPEDNNEGFNVLNSNHERNSESKNSVKIQEERNPERNFEMDKGQVLPNYLTFSLINNNPIHVPDAYAPQQNIENVFNYNMDSDINREINQIFLQHYGQFAKLNTDQNVYGSTDKRNGGKNGHAYGNAYSTLFRDSGSNSLHPKENVYRNSLRKPSYNMHEIGTKHFQDVRHKPEDIRRYPYLLTNSNQNSHPTNVKYSFDEQEEGKNHKTRNMNSFKDKRLVGPGIYDVLDSKRNQGTRNSKPIFGDSMRNGNTQDFQNDHIKPNNNEYFYNFRENKEQIQRPQETKQDISDSNRFSYNPVVYPQTNDNLRYIKDYERNNKAKREHFLIRVTEPTGDEKTSKSGEEVSQENNYQVREEREGREANVPKDTGRGEQKDQTLDQSATEHITSDIVEENSYENIPSRGNFDHEHPWVQYHHSGQDPQVHETTKTVPVHEDIKIPVPHPVRHPIFIPVPVRVEEPFPIRIPVPVPVEKTVKVPVEKLVPYPVMKPVPFKVIKNVPVPVSKPYPVKVPVYKIKYVHHKQKKQQVEHS